MTQKILSVSSLSWVHDADQLKKLQFCDLVEMRVDDFSVSDLEILKTFSLKPWILKTLSKNSIENCLAYKPTFVDLDFFTLQDLISLQVKVPVILSMHIEGDLNQVMEAFEQLSLLDVEYYKLVVKPIKRIEGLKITHFFRKMGNKKFTCFCMGEDFTYSRFFGLIDQHPFIYMGFEGMLTAKGQLSIEQLQDYPVFIHPPSLFGLIGDPVTKSISDAIYNYYFKIKNINAIYMKIPLSAEEAHEGVFWLKKLNFHGLSITTPLKNMFGSFFNTVDLKNDRFFNTDKEGFLDLLKKIPLMNKKALVIGFGAVGQMVATALIDEGFSVKVYNRSLDKIRAFSAQYPVEVYSDSDEAFDVVIQTSSESFFDPHKDTFFHAKSSAFIEVVQVPIVTSFIKKAFLEKKPVFLGLEWFLSQGYLQLCHFLKEHDLTDFFSQVYSRAVLEILKKC